MATQKKIEAVEKLIEKLSQAKTIVLADYQGLNHQQLEDLRKAVKRAKGDFVVVKNNLLKIASEKTGLSKLSTLVSDQSGPIALLLAYDDEILPLKEIASYAKQFRFPSLKTGILSGELLNSDQLAVVAALPGKEVLLGRVVGQIKSPLSGLHNALSWNLRKLTLTLNAIQKQKS